MLRIDHLDVWHGNLHVVWDLSLEVRKGEIVTLLGPNGAGKTTLVETIIGLNRNARGSIQFLEQEILGLQPYEIVKRGIALVPEKRELFPKMSVRENLSLGGHLNTNGKSDPGTDTKYVPCSQGAAGATRGHIIRRGAADAGNWPESDVKTEVARTG